MKRILLILAVMAITLCAFSQISIGPRLGVNFSVIDGKWDEYDEPEYNWITGPVIGVAGKYSISKLFSARAELGYITMGEEVEYTYDEKSSMQSMKHIFKERYNCIQLSMLAQALFGGKNMNALVFLGPYVTHKGGGKLKIEDNTMQKNLEISGYKIENNMNAVSNGNEEVYDIVWGTPPDGNNYHDGKYYVDPDYNRRTDIGIYIGGGIGKDIGPGNLELNVRLGMGLVDLNKFENKEDKDAAKDSGYESYNSRNVSISLIYWFKLND